MKFFAALLFSCFLLACIGPPAAAAAMQDYPVVSLKALDKVTARTMAVEAAVGDTIKFGSIFIKVRACRKTDPVERPESAAFLQIWEMTPEDEAQWIFSGWMFASSPALSAMDHAIYDVWVIDCLKKKGGSKADAGPLTQQKQTEGGDQADGGTAEDLGD